jgi:YVTN family beta-propeller protein
MSAKVLGRQSVAGSTYMKVRLLIAAFALAGLLGSGQSLAQNAYITNGRSNTVSVIDTNTNTVTATIPVGAGPIGAAASPDGSEVYITNEFSFSVSVIATATNTMTATIRLTVGLVASERRIS